MSNVRDLSVRTRRWGLRVALFALLCSASIAAAQESDTPPPGYREAIQEAVTEHDAHNYIEAKALFARAHKLFPNARTLRGLGAVSFELQHYSESVSILEQALASKHRALEGPLREETERLLARARGFIAEIELTLQPSDTRVIVDGTDEVQTNTLRLDAGKHEIDFQAPGYQPEVRRYTVQGGEAKSWTITLQPTGGSSVAEVVSEASAEPQEPGLAPVEAPPKHPRGWQIATASATLALAIGTFAAATALSIKRHHAALDFEASMTKSANYPELARAWTSARRAPYALEAASSALLTAGSLTLLLSAERKAFPWWASTLSAAAGIGLTSWGVAQIASGKGGCANQVDARECSIQQEKRDRGGLATLGALPLLAIPITQLVRGLFDSDDGRTSFLLIPGAAPQQRAVSLEAHLQWL